MYRGHNMHEMRFFGIFVSLKNNLQQITANLHRISSGVFLLFSISAYAATVGSALETQTDMLSNNPDVSIFTERVLFPKASAVVLGDFTGNNIRLDSILSFLRKTDSKNLLSVNAEGSYSPEGRFAFNTRLAHARATALAKLISKINPDVTPVITIRHPEQGHNVDYRQMRAAELQIVYRNKAVADSIVSASSKMENSNLQPSVTLDTISAPEVNDASSVADNESREVVRQDTPLSIPASHSFWSKWFVTTNMLYDAALTPNIGAGISIADRFTVQADWMYARWSNRDKRRYWRIYGGDLEVRCRIGSQVKGSPLGGHYVGVYGSLACYDFQAGCNHSGVLSDKYNYAVGVSYTYSLPVSTHFNIDFNLGLGYLWGTYKKHTPIDDCNVWLSTHKLGWVGPTRVGVTLVWLAGNGVKNSKKGGGR